MAKDSVIILLFTFFAFGLPIWGMQNNGRDGDSIHNCSGDCYTQWHEQTGGAFEMAAAKVRTRAQASPAELGKEVYTGCIACHGSGGEGGIGPALAQQSATELAAKLVQYKKGETRGKQSALMWSQAAQLSDSDIENITAYLETL